MFFGNIVNNENKGENKIPWIKFPWWEGDSLLAFCLQTKPSLQIQLQGVPRNMTVGKYFKMSSSIVF